MNQPEPLIKEFQDRFGKKPDFLGFAPGRVNLMGEHVDYNDGFVFPVAIDRKVTIAFGPSGNEYSTLRAMDFHSEIELDPCQLVDKRNRQGNELPGWALYPAGIQFVLQDEGLSTPGMQAVFSADIPRGAGLSSSAAVELAFAKAWQSLAGWEKPAPDLAKMAQRAESQYVGVRCGIMDQYASACGRKGCAIFLDCRDLTSRYVALPAGYAIVIADSGVRHSLADGSGSYNERRAACEGAVQLLQAWMPGIHSLRDVPVEIFEQYAGRLPENFRLAARHVVGEIERTIQAVEQLEAGDVSGFGKCMLESHASLRDLYRVSCPELDIMVRIAMELPGCLGSRLTGAGFGGCTVNLVEIDQSDSFMETLKVRYQKETGINPDITLCHSEDGATVAAL
jgi:galactokinase